MKGYTWLSYRYTPYMDIMHIDYSDYLLQVLIQSRCVYVIRRCFHKNIKAIFAYRPCRTENNNRKDKRADGSTILIPGFPFWKKYIIHAARSTPHDCIISPRM